MAAGSPSAGSGASAPVAPTGDVTLQGAGATFPAPLYQTWFETYNGVYPNIQIDYQAIGSGGGIKGITDQTVDFGASDAAMKDEEIAALKPGVKVLHVPDRPRRRRRHLQRARRDRPSTSTPTPSPACSLGTITNWNDPKIAALNAGRDAARPPRHGRPPLGRLGHHERLHDLPRHRQPRLAHERSAPARRSSGRPASAPRATTASPAASSRRRARSATSSSTTPRRRASRRRRVKNAAGKFVAGQHGRRDRGRRGRRGRLPGRLPPGADHQRRRRCDLPDRLLHLPPHPGRLVRPRPRPRRWCRSPTGR